MFLDDELLQLGRSTELTEAGIKSCIGDMVRKCFDSLTKNIKTPTDQVIKANFKRVNTTWIIVANQLESEGRGFIKEDGFKLFVESKPEFAGIFFK